MAVAKSADLIFNIIGRDKASGAFHSAGRAAAKLDDDVKKTHKSFLGLSSVGKAVGAGLAGMGLAAAGREAIQFAKESVEAFRTVGSESMKMQRLLGGSIEEASLLRGVAKLSGQDIDSFAKSMGLFSKQIVNNGDAFAELGISVTDANGAIKPTQTLLKETADVFAAMPAGAEETALAMKLFGKSGADLLPFLNKGSAGIAELEAKTKELGMTMSQADADGLKKFTAATREMDMAMEGSKATLGKSLMPVMTELKTAAAAIAIPLTQAVTPAFVALGDVAVLAVQSIGENMPAVKAAVADLASGIRGAADAVKDNWPAIKDTIGTVSDAIKRVTDVTKTLWDAFRGLPPEVQQTLATLAVLQKTGAINVAFSGANLAKDLLAKVTGMNVQAGVVNVAGAAGGAPVPAGAAGAGAAGASGLTVGTAAGPVLVLTAAYAALYGVSKAIEEVQKKVFGPEAGAQVADFGRTMIGSSGFLMTFGEKLKDVYDKLRDGRQTTDQARVSFEAWGNKSLVMRDVASAAGVSAEKMRDINQAIAEMPPGTTAAEAAARIREVGSAAGLTDGQVNALANSVLGIPGGANTWELEASVTAAGVAANMSAQEIALMNIAVATIPPGSNGQVIAANLQAAGLAAGMTQQEIDAVTAAVLGVPPAASTTVTSPGAPQSAREIAEHTNQAGLVPYARSTSVSAPGAPGSAGQLRDVRSAADQVNGTRTISVHAETSGAYSQLNSLLSWARSQTVTILSKILPGGATGMAVPAFASGGGTPMMVSNGEFYASPATVARTGGTGVWHALNTGMISGPGTGTSDSIQALGQPGGFVLNARATRRYRPVLRHLADGGPTGAVATMTAPTTTERVALYIDGRMIHESLIRLKRERGGADLGLA